MTKDSIICLGKFDDNILSVENNIIKLLGGKSKDKLTYDDSQSPDVIKYSNEDYKYDVWAILGNVKPTLLLKNLLSEVRFIIFIFNLSEPDKLTFLTEGWGPIIQKSIKTNPESQERILLGIKPKSYIIPKEMKLKIQNSKKILQYTRFIEDVLSDEFSESTENSDFYNFITNELAQKKSNPPSIGQSNTNFNEEVNESSNSELGEINDLNSNNLIVYEIDENSHKAKIVEWPNAEGQIVINKFANYQSKKYEIIEICQNAFKSSKTKKIFVKTDLKIGDSCFSDSNELITAKFECKKLTLDNRSFLNCLSLSDISFSGINEAVFGSQIFNGCGRLESFEIQCEDNSKISIGDDCFAGAVSLKSIKLSADSIVLGKNIFKNCEALKNLEIECKNESLSISKELFEGCGSLENVVFKKSTLNLCDSCFSNLGNLKTINCFECNEVNFGENCFLNCFNVESIDIECKNEIELKKKIFSGFQTFSKKEKRSKEDLIELKKLKSMKLCGKKVTINEVYSDFTSLKSLSIKSCLNKLPNESSILVYLGNSCFQNLINLENLEINAASVFIGKNCFDNCSSLKNVTISNLMKMNNGIDPFKNCVNIDKVTLEYQSNAKLKLLKNPFSKSLIKNFEIKDNGSKTLNVELCDKCFKSCISIHEFVISSSNEVSFGSKVFKKSKNLNRIEINAQSKIQFSNNCFENSKCLENALFYSNNLVIGNYCFIKCDKLKSITTLSNTVFQFGKGRVFERHDSEDPAFLVYDIIK